MATRAAVVASNETSAEVTVPKPNQRIEIRTPCPAIKVNNNGAANVLSVKMRCNMKAVAADVATRSTSDASHNQRRSWLPDCLGAVNVA